MSFHLLQIHRFLTLLSCLINEIVLDLEMSCHSVLIFLVGRMTHRSSFLLQFHKDNLQHLPQFPDFFVTFRILSILSGNY